MGGLRPRRAAACAVAAAAALLALPAAAPAFDQSRELQNYSKIGERFAHDQANVDYQLDELRIGTENMLDLIRRDLRDRERLSLTLCASGFQGCSGDVRTYNWRRGGGLSAPVIFMNRNGAHLEGHVWASRESLERGEPLPGVVIETGSVQAPERLYWWQAQVLANHGYLVMTFDVQGQGRSDTLGSPPQTFEEVPSQQESTFTEGLVDALDFFTSTPSSPHVPREPAGARRQRQEVRRHDADAHNPLHGLLDSSRIGTVGHSLGARAVSVVQAQDARIDAIVAWDNLSSSAKPRVPALGMSADYGLTPTPYRAQPHPQDKNAGFLAWQQAGVDVMQINVRGGTHYEWSYISNPLFGATLRGIDMSAWYTTAWLDRYVKGDPTADRRLLTSRWLQDPISRRVDPNRDDNMYSFYFRSRADFDDAGGSPVRCDDLRRGCAALVVDDGEPASPPYSFLDDRF